MGLDSKVDQAAQSARAAPRAPSRLRAAAAAGLLRRRALEAREHVEQRGARAAGVVV
jgi:hypothetical protein